jgi:hypothetical protein
VATVKQGLRGSDALQILESSASRDLKRTRELVEEASMADLASYFKGAEMGELSPSVKAELVSAGIAGGQWGFNALMQRLTSTNVHEADYEEVANEILEVISPLAKILNYSRFRATAIQSYVSQCSGRSLKMHSNDISKTELKKYEDQITFFRDTTISNAESLKRWVDSVDEFCVRLSEPSVLDSILMDTATSRGKKGTVSSKSISSYSKHWKSYALEILSGEIGIKWSGDHKESINEKVKHLINYQTRNWTKLQKDLNETRSTRRSYKSTRETNKLKNVESKKVTAEHHIDGRLVSITYNLPGVDEDLIQPALNSIRAQMMRNVKQGKVSFTMKSDRDFLSIEMEKALKEDVETLKVLLNSHRR